MLTLHDFLIDSEKEIAFREENKALRKNHAVLTSQLNNIETILHTLDQEDKKLHSKFFNTILENGSTTASGTSRRHLLLSDAASFRKAAEKIQIQSATLLEQAYSADLDITSKLPRERQAIIKSLAIPAIQPVSPWLAENLISGFGMRINPFHKGLYKHQGIDIAATRGTEVIATADGKISRIKKSDLQAGYGNFIEITHDNGFITRYAHLEEIRVKLNQKVDKGSVVATTGNSGGSIAPHLHYEIIRNGKNVDPVNYMIEGLGSNDFNYLKVIGNRQNQSLD